MQIVEAVIHENGEVELLEPLKLAGKRRALVTILDEHHAKEQRPFGLAEGEFTVPDDFNDPLPDDLLHSFEGS